MKIEIPVKVFRVAGFYYAAIRQGGKYAIVELQGSPFSSNSAATGAILKVAYSGFEQFARSRLSTDYKERTGRKKKRR